MVQTGRGSGRTVHKAVVRFGKEQAANKGALDVQNCAAICHFAKTSVKSRPGGMRKRSRAEGAVATSARLGWSKKVTKGAERGIGCLSS